MKKLFLSIAAFFARILPISVKQAIYKNKSLAGLIRGSLNKAAPQGHTTAVIAAGGLQGMSMVLDMQTEKDFWLGTYEPEMQAALEELVKPGMIVFDVGANIGYVTLLLAKAIGEKGKVYAFEALPDNVRRLARNIEINDMLPRVSIQQMAVTVSAGDVKFLVHASGGMGKAVGSAGRDEKYIDEITVSGISLDEFVFEWKNPAPQVVKMDIEGGEVMALPGMLRLLRESHPIMLMELHGQESARVAWDTLIDQGYRICEMKSGFPPIPSLDALDWKAYIVGTHDQGHE